MRQPSVKRNVPGYIDEQGRFRPIRSPQYVGGRAATAKDRRKYSKVLGGDLGADKQQKALAEKWEMPWDKEERLEREERERVQREIDGEIRGGRTGKTLLQFVRGQGGIKRQFRHGGKKAFGKRSEYDKGEIDRLSYKDLGARGLTSETGGKTLDKMYQAAVSAGYDVGGIDDLISRIEDEAKGGNATYATHGSMAYNPKTKAARANPDNAIRAYQEYYGQIYEQVNRQLFNANLAQIAALAKKYGPRHPDQAHGISRDIVNGKRSPSWMKITVPKKNPDVVATFAHLASGILSAVQINEMMKVRKKPTRRKKNGTTQAKRRNPAVKAKAATKPAAKKANPVKKTVVTAKKANPRKTVKVPAKGRFYLQTIAQGDDVIGVFINDRDGDGIARKFKTAAAAKAYATKHRLRLENPAAEPRKVNPQFAPKWIKELLGTTAAAKKSAAAAKKANPATKSVAAKATKNPAFYYQVKTASEARGVYNISNLVRARREAKARAADRGEAVTIRRYKHLSMYDGPGAKIVAVVKPPKKKNPTVPRRRTFEMFQGRKATQARPMIVSRHAPARLDQLGNLHELKIAGGPTLKFNGGPKLCAARGKLWIAGKRFAKPDTTQPTHVVNPIGEIDHVVYSTYKPHHGDPPDQHYIHKLGEWSGKRPVLCVDRDGMPVIRGGNYTIEDRGIVD